MALLTAASMFSASFRRILLLHGTRASPPSMRRLPISSLSPSLSAAHMDRYRCVSTAQFPETYAEVTGTTRPTGMQSSLSISIGETRRLLRLVKLNAMKKRLESSAVDCICYTDFLSLCRSMGVASSEQDAEEFAKALDQVGRVFIFRGNVYLQPQQLADLVAKALAVPNEDDPRLHELERLRSTKREIHKNAKQNANTLFWSSLCFLGLQIGLCAHLAFWELSWDVMQPVIYFMMNGE
eukprot:c24952_g3_i3 orf=474-1190(-)